MSGPYSIDTEGACFAWIIWLSIKWQQSPPSCFLTFPCLQIPPKSRSYSINSGKGTDKTKGKNKEGLICKTCKTEFNDEHDKIVQCEDCINYYCTKCLNVSDKENEHFKSPSLHWFCPSCEEKVMKNLRSDHEVEIRCTQLFKAMANRVVKNLKLKARLMKQRSTMKCSRQQLK